MGPISAGTVCSHLLSVLRLAVNPSDAASLRPRSNGKCPGCVCVGGGGWSGLGLRWAELRKGFGAAEIDLQKKAPKNRDIPACIYMALCMCGCLCIQTLCQFIPQLAPLPYTAVNSHR